MSERIEASLSEALLAQRAVLRRARASAALDARFEQSLATWRTRRVRAGRRRRSSWALAAAAAGVLIAGTAWLVMHIGTLPAQQPLDCTNMTGAARAARRRPIAWRAAGVAVIRSPVTWPVIRHP